MSVFSTPSPHIPVLAHKLVDALCIKASGVYVDATAGYGGHARMVWQRLSRANASTQTSALSPLRASTQGHLVLLDRDPEATRYLSELFTKLKAHQEGQVLPTHSIITAPFSSLTTHLTSLNLVGKVNGLYADLGVSSAQLDTPSRGFSFHHNHTIDMRMNKQDALQTSAKDVLAMASEEELRDIFYRYGEEPKSKYAARAIVQARTKKPIETTHELASILSNAMHYKGSKKHPATRIFQALRIHVNDELGELGELLSTSYSLLAHGGVLAIISFHSLEDRLIKQHFKALANTEHKIPKTLTPVFANSENLKKLAWTKAPKAKIIKPFPLQASEAEMQNNPRARSAKLRVLQKL